MGNNVTITIGADSKQAIAVFQRLGDAIKTGFGQQIGSRLTNALASIPSALVRAAKAGFDFNTVLETSRLSLASVLRTFAPGQNSSFPAALSNAETLIRDLKVAATETTASFQDLLQAYQATAGSMFAAGIPIEKQVRLMLLLSQAVAGVGLQGFQLPQEARALLTGNIGPDATLARTMGITGADVKGWISSGTMLQNLERRLAAFSEAGKLAGETMAGLTSNLGDAIRNAMAELTGGAWTTTRDSLKVLIRGLSSSEFSAGIAKMSAFADKVIAMAMGAAAEGVGMVAAAGSVDIRKSLARGTLGEDLGRARGMQLRDAIFVDPFKKLINSALSAAANIGSPANRSYTDAYERKVGALMANEDRRRRFETLAQDLAFFKTNANSSWLSQFAWPQGQGGNSGFYATAGGGQSWMTMTSLVRNILKELQDSRRELERGLRLDPTML